MKVSFYNHPRIVALLLIAIIVAGFNALQTMPRLEDPFLQSRFLRVSTFYPGADAERVEAEVTKKLENKMREISEIKNIYASSRPGISLINLELEDRVDNAAEVLARLRDKVGEVTDLPPGTLAPDFNEKSVYAHSAIIALKWRSDAPINYAILGRHARELESKLRNVQGTDFVDISGLPKEEIRVTLDAALLAAHGFTTDDIVARVKGSDARGAGGTVAGDRNRFVVEVSGALETLERIRSIPLGFEQSGAALRLGDVAKVERAVEDPPSAFGYLNGTYGVTVSVRMLQTMRIDHWSDDIAVLLREFEKTLPGGIELERIFDQKIYANSRIYGLLTNLGIGALVVVSVLFFSLGWRASLISASILPLTLLTALAIVSALGLRIEQMLITGMIVSLGIMVDNAIVVTDEIQHRLLAGMRRSQAVAETIKKLWMPLFGSTLTTIIAFMPLILMPGPSGDFMIGVPASVIASLVASYIIAFTIISALAGHAIEQRPPGSDISVRTWWRDGLTGGALSRMFERSLRWSLARPIRSILFAMIVPAMGFLLMGQLTEQFFPTSDRNQFQIQLNMPPQASISDTRRAVERAHEIVLATEGVTSAYWYAGSKAPKFYYNLFGDKEGVVSAAEAMVTVTNYELIKQIIPKLQDILDVDMPEAMILVRELGTGPPIRAPLEVRIVGPNLGELERIGNAVRSKMASLPVVTGTTASLAVGRPQIVVQAFEDEVSATGMSLSGLANQVNQLTSGVVATHVIEETHAVPVRLIIKRSDRANIGDIRDLGLKGGAGELEQDNSFADVPLSAIADVKLEARVGAIQRRNGERINTISGFTAQGVLPEVAFQQLKIALDDAGLVTGNAELGPSYRIEFGGESEERDEALGNLFGTVGLLAILMLMAIVVTFNSFRMAGVTFTAAIQAAALGFFCLWVFNMPLTFPVILALMGLIGLAINATIVILSELRGRADARSGDMNAVVRGVMATGRHILSTTLTTVGGFMPLILTSGKMWPPFGVAIAGGALLSMIVSFYFAPAAFLWLTRRRSFMAAGQRVPRSKAPLESAE